MGTRSSRAKALIAVVLLGACSAAPRSPVAPRPDEASLGARLDLDAGDAEAALDADTDDEDAAASDEVASPCPRNMALVATEGGRFCIDMYEASLVEVDKEGNETPFPHWLPVDGHVVRAVSEREVYPQGFISEIQADDACIASGKRLCTYPEWKTACMGPSRTTFPYGAERQAGMCHDSGKSAVFAVFGARAFTDPVAHAPPKPSGARSSASKSPAKGRPGAKPKELPKRQPHVTVKGRAAESVRSRPSRGAAPRPQAPRKKTPPSPAKQSTKPASISSSVWAQLNDPRLGRVEGALATTGSHEACTSTYGALDMVGNLHEWVKTDASTDHGTFAGGYYLDTHLNGDGCQYRTTAHAHDYHDYSTGFRCCADAAPE